MRKEGGGTTAGIRGVIFDLDGVLVHTDRFHCEAWKRIANQCGVPFDETVNDRLRGVGRMDSLEIILEAYEGPELSPEEKYRLTEQKNELYRCFLQTMGPRDISEEVRGTLSSLKKRGYLLAVGSSSRNAPFIVRQTGLEPFFDAVIDGSQLQRPKPDPQVFLLAAARLGAEAAECAVVEDAVSGVLAAQSAGMVSVGIGSAVPAEASDYHIDHLQELLEMF